jgi:hypothetical protein
MFHTFMCETPRIYFLGDGQGRPLGKYTSEMSRTFQTSTTILGMFHIYMCNANDTNVSA